MESIEKIGKIKSETLSEEHYFQSLLEGAYGAGLLSETELEKMQLDCLVILSKKTERFNGGDSSSIPIERAQDILASVIFTVGVALKTHSNADDAVSALLSLGVETVYEMGRKRIDRLVTQAKMQYKLLVGHLLKTGNTFYSSTITEGIGGFFKLYDPDFAAHEIHITADYPVYNSTNRLLGIEFIKKYLEQLYYENLFCTFFSVEEIHHLLLGYDKSYENLLFSIYEVVLAASLGCVVSGSNTAKVEITAEKLAFLYNRFKGKSRDEICEILGNALLKLGEILGFSENLTDYAENSLSRLGEAVEMGIKAGSLEGIFILPQYTGDRPKLIIPHEARMEDELYRRVLDMFIATELISDKIRIIKSHIHSVDDLEDLLLDAEPSAHEMGAILKSLSPAQIVVLIKKYKPLYEIGFNEFRDSERALCKGLIEFSAALNEGQRQTLEKAVDALDTEDE